MQSLTEAEILKSFINCSKGEAKRLNVPPRLSEVDWESLEFFSWIDMKNPQKACVVVPQQDGAVAGVLLTRAKAQGKKAQMCSFCMTLHPGSGISLFSAAKTGESGCRGNTLGTYICSNFALRRLRNGQEKARGNPSNGRNPHRRTTPCPHVRKCPGFCGTPPPGFLAKQLVVIFDFLDF